MTTTLLPTQVRAIRRALELGASYRELADAYGTIPLVIWQIHKKKAYKSVPDPMTERQHSRALEAVRQHNNLYLHEWPQFHRPLSALKAKVA